jgi:hypothetical protein
MQKFSGVRLRKYCARCDKTKPASEFYSNKSQCDGLASHCKECAKRIQKELYSKNPEKHRARKREYIKRYGPAYNKLRRTKRRETHITEAARKYKISKDAISRLLETKSCPICLREISFSAQNIHCRPNIDHDHSTGKIRGVICGYCNNLLGRAGDSPETLIRATAYLNGIKCITT